MTKKSELDEVMALADVYWKSGPNTPPRRALETKVKSLLDALDRQDREIGRLTGSLIEREDALEEAQRDARRWQHVRNHSSAEGIELTKFDPPTKVQAPLWADIADRAVDAAIAETQQENKHHEG